MLFKIRGGGRLIYFPLFPPPKKITQATVHLSHSILIIFGIFQQMFLIPLSNDQPCLMNTPKLMLDRNISALHPAIPQKKFDFLLFVQRFQMVGPQLFSGSGWLDCTFFPGPMGCDFCCGKTIGVLIFYWSLE